MKLSIENLRIRIKKEIKKRELTQQQVATMIGTSQGNLSRFLNGIHKGLGSEELLKLLVLLDLIKGSLASQASLNDKKHDDKAKYPNEKSTNQ